LHLSAPLRGAAGEPQGVIRLLKCQRRGLEIDGVYE
jgi:hypothetical protein